MELKTNWFVPFPADAPFPAGGEVGEVLCFVPDPETACHWYADVLRVPVELADGPLRLRIGAVELTFHLGDSASPVGSGGQVAYWRVPDFDAVRTRALGAGATAGRGPLLRADGLRMGQVRDPFGNVLGLLGP